MSKKTIDSLITPFNTAIAAVATYFVLQLGLYAAEKSHLDSFPITERAGEATMQINAFEKNGNMATNMLFAGYYETAKNYLQNNTTGRK